MNVFYSFTHQGLVRKENQDHWCVIEHKDANLYLVADGMGGHLGGEVASRMACEEIEKLTTCESELTISRVILAVENANHAVWTKSVSDQSLKGMGTTLILLYQGRDAQYFINVGDSRLYGWDGKHLDQLSSDDSYVNLLVQAGEITKEQAETHPKRSFITKALGTDKQLHVEAHPIITQFEAFLLCSDGLSSLVDIRLMEKAFLSEHQENLADKLGSLALDAGGTDNITLIVAQGNKVGV